MTFISADKKLEEDEAEEDEDCANVTGEASSGFSGPSAGFFLPGV